MSVLQINDNDIIDPQTMTWDLYDLDSEDGAGRNQSGEMFRDRVAVKRKVNCTWGPLEPYEMSELLQAISPYVSPMLTMGSIVRGHSMWEIVLLPYICGTRKKGNISGKVLPQIL